MDMLLLRISATSLPRGDVTSSNCPGTEAGSIDSPRGRLCECLAIVEDLLLSVSCLPTMPAQRLMAFATIYIHHCRFEVRNYPYQYSLVRHLSALNLAQLRAQGEYILQHKKWPANLTRRSWSRRTEKLPYQLPGDAPAEHGS